MVYMLWNHNQMMRVTNKYVHHFKFTRKKYFSHGDREKTAVVITGWGSKRPRFISQRTHSSFPPSINLDPRDLIPSFVLCKPGRKIVYKFT